MLNPAASVTDRSALAISSGPGCCGPAPAGGGGGRNRGFVPSLLPHRRDGPGEGETQPLQARPSWEAALSGEAEAFLEGRLVEHLVAAHRKVPAWAVLNKVAHASVRELADLVETDAGMGSAGGVAGPLWLSAQRSLALVSSGVARSPTRSSGSSERCWSRWGCG